MQTEAMSKKNWERGEKGLPPLKVEKIKRPEPERPKIENEIKFDDIPINDFVELEYARRKTIKNSEGVRFIGYEVSMVLGPLKRKQGRPKESEKDDIQGEPKTLSGWMGEGDFLSLVRTCRKKINQQVINW